MIPPHTCCPVVRAFLQALGVAAVRPVTPDQWRQHFAEERAHLWPLLPLSLVQRFEREHDLFTYELATFGLIVSVDLLQIHSQLEDRSVLEILRARREAP